MKRLAWALLLVDSVVLISACSTRIPGYPSGDSSLSSSYYYQQDVRLQAQQCGFSPGRIEVKVGRPVKLTVTSVDVYHGLGVEGLDIGPASGQGRTITYLFTPLKEGEYRFACNVACGCGHVGDMNGVLIVSNGTGGR